jgi:hypothetical protein
MPNYPSMSHLFGESLIGAQRSVVCLPLPIHRTIPWIFCVPWIDWQRLCLLAARGTDLQVVWGIELTGPNGPVVKIYEQCFAHQVFADLSPQPTGDHKEGHHLSPTPHSSPTWSLHLHMIQLALGHYTWQLSVPTPQFSKGAFSLVAVSSDVPCNSGKGAEHLPQVQYGSHLENIFLHTRSTARSSGSHGELCIPVHAEARLAPVTRMVFF